MQGRVPSGKRRGCSISANGIAIARPHGRRDAKHDSREGAKTRSHSAMMDWTVDRGGTIWSSCLRAFARITSSSSHQARNLGAHGRASGPAAQRRFNHAPNRCSVRTDRGSTTLAALSQDGRNLRVSSVPVFPKAALFRANSALLIRNRANT